jgi:hypothetical protein
MAGNASDYLESGLRSHLFRSATFAKPTVLAIVLSSGTPVDSMTGSNCLEWQNAGGYVRQTLNPSDTNWSADNLTQGLTYNNQAITFPVCTLPGGWVSGILIADSATYGQGQILVWGSSTVPKYFDLNDQCIIPVSGLSFQID